MERKLDLRNAPWALTNQREVLLLVVSIGYRQQAAAKRECQIRSVTPLPLFAKVVSVALVGRSLPVVCRCAGGGGAARAHWRLSWMLAQAASVASRYAFGADGVGAARLGACGEADRRLALSEDRQTRCTALRYEAFS